MCLPEQAGVWWLRPGLLMALYNVCLVPSTAQHCPALSIQGSLILIQSPFSQEQAQKVPGSSTKMLTAKGSKGS